MGLAFSEIDDAVLLTMEGLIEQGAFTDLQTDLTEFVAINEMWKHRSHKFNGGHPWTFDAQIANNGSASAVGLYQTDTDVDPNTMIDGSIDVRHVNAHYIYDQRIAAFQGGGHQIVDFVKTKYSAMMMSFYETLETMLWGKPATSADKLTPFGLAYWVTKNATQGFNGGNPTGFTDGRAGISTGDQARWANYTDSYTDVSKTDLIRKMKKALRLTSFKSPLSHKRPEFETRNGIYANSETIEVIEEVMEDQNMNVGNDLGGKGALFKGVPISYAPKLDADTDDPVYMIDWKTMAVGTLPGWENNLSKPNPVPNKHLVRRVDLDASLNMACTDLRKQTVIIKS